MRIALVKVQDMNKTLAMSSVQYPVNLGYLAAVCLAAGHQVQMWDYCVEPFSEEYVGVRIREFRPDIIGLSCVTPAIYFGHQIASIAKQINRDIFIIVGGPHVSAIPVETLLEFPGFDMGIIGEAEETLPEVIAAVEKKRFPSVVPGTVYRQDEKIKLAPARAKMPDVNAVPFPNRDMVSFNLYKDKHATRGFSRRVWNIAEMDSSRGCVFACSFCSVEMNHGKGVRFRQPENIFREIEICRRKYDTNFIVFNDSTFTLDKKRVKEITKYLPQAGIKGYTVNSHVNTVDYEMLAQMAETGCKRISFGVESGSEKVLKAIHKQSSREKIIAAFKNARRAKIPVVEGTMILGADPEESEDDFKQTESLIKVIRPDILVLTIITPFPGTEVYAKMKRLCCLEGIGWDRFQQFAETPPPWRIAHFSAEELVKRRNAILKSYIWSPGYVFNRMVKIKSLKELLYYIAMAKSFYSVVVRFKAGKNEKVAGSN